MPVEIVLFPVEAIALQLEIANHPSLQLQLASLPDEAPMEERFAVILAYAGMAVDGYYNNDDTARLFSDAIVRLKSMNKIYID